MALANLWGYVPYLNHGSGPRPWFLGCITDPDVVQVTQVLEARRPAGGLGIGSRDIKARRSSGGLGLGSQDLEDEQQQPADSASTVMFVWDGTDAKPYASRWACSAVYPCVRHPTGGTSGGCRFRVAAPTRVEASVHLICCSYDCLAACTDLQLMCAVCPPSWRVTRTALHWTGRPWI